MKGGFIMNTRNSRNNREQATGDPRYLDQVTIKNIEDIAYPNKEGQDTDVKIWTPQTRQK